MHGDSQRCASSNNGMGPTLQQEFANNNSEIEATSALPSTEGVPQSMVKVSVGPINS